MLEKLLANVATIEPRDGLQSRLASAAALGRKLKVKLGFDPTAPDLHLGHAVVLQKLRDFQDLGHHVIVIIGDFTASIGDPTGRNKMRPPLTSGQIEKNSETYIAQLGKVLDLQSVEIRRNSEWLAPLDLTAVIKLMSKVTLAQIMQRDDFEKRYDGGVPIHLHELLYPILQGYDSLMIDADVELGGTDQLFNNLMGRSIQEAHGREAQVVMTMPLLVGTDGIEKMSKSKNNYIGLTESPTNMYGKAMSIPDALIENYLHLTTTLTSDEQAAVLKNISAGENPMLAKKTIAENIVARFFTNAEAHSAAQHFERTVQRKSSDMADYETLDFDEAISQLSERATLLHLCAFAIRNQSRSELRRLIRGGGVKINGEPALNEAEFVGLTPKMTLRIGRRHHFRFDQKAGRLSQA